MWRGAAGADATDEGAGAAVGGVVHRMCIGGAS